MPRVLGLARIGQAAALATHEDVAAGVQLCHSPPAALAVSDILGAQEPGTSAAEMAPSSTQSARAAQWISTVLFPKDAKKTAEPRRRLLVRTRCSRPARRGATTTRRMFGRATTAHRDASAARLSRWSPRRSATAFLTVSWFCSVRRLPAPTRSQPGCALVASSAWWRSVGYRSCCHDVLGLSPAWR